jgi:hypothetical protein
MRLTASGGDEAKVKRFLNQTIGMDEKAQGLVCIQNANYPASLEVRKI